MVPLRPSCQSPGRRRRGTSESGGSEPYSRRPPPPARAPAPTGDPRPAPTGDPAPGRTARKGLRPSTRTTPTTPRPAETATSPSRGRRAGGPHRARARPASSRHLGPFHRVTRPPLPGLVARTHPGLSPHRPEHPAGTGRRPKGFSARSSRTHGATLAGRRTGPTCPGGYCSGNEGVRGGVVGINPFRGEKKRRTPK